MRIAVLGAGGFIGGHLTRSLLESGCDVVATDIKPFDEWYQLHEGAQNISADLRIDAPEAVAGCEQVYHLAADMGGMGFIESHKADCALNTQMDIAVLLAARDAGVRRLLFTSTACVYPGSLQNSEDPLALTEDMAYPADPEDGYGWSKLYMERLCRHFSEDYGLETRIARLHTVYGPNETWDGGREKVPAALSRKLALAKRHNLGEIEVWGDGRQARTFLYVSDAVRALQALMHSGYDSPVNVGSEHVVSVDELARLLAGIAEIPDVALKHVPGPLGVRGRAPDLTVARRELGWEPAISLEHGMRKTYQWVEEQAWKTQS